MPFQVTSQTRPEGGGGFKQPIISSEKIPAETIQQALTFCAEHDIEVKRFRWVVEPPST